MKNYLLQTLIYLRGDLIKTAKKRETIPYKTLMKRYEISRGTANGLGIGWLVGYVSEYESEHGRPLISAIVVRRGSQTKLFPKGHPGSGFMQIDCIPKAMRRKTRKDRPLTPKEQRFIVQCQNDVWNYWAPKKLSNRSLTDFLN